MMCLFKPLHLAKAAESALQILLVSGRAHVANENLTRRLAERLIHVVVALARQDRSRSLRDHLQSNRTGRCKESEHEFRQETEFH